MKHYFTKTEIALWSASACAIVLSFFLFDRENYMTLAASLIGVTSLIFNAKDTVLVALNFSDVPANLRQMNGL